MYKGYGEGRRGQAQRWNPTRRRFPIKGYQDEKTLSPEKICNENQFNTLSELEDENNQNANNNITKESAQIIKQVGKEEGEMSTREWVASSFHCQDNQEKVPDSTHEEPALQKSKNLIHEQREKEA